MRKPIELPEITKTPVDYAVPSPIGGSEYLTTPGDDLRWWVIANDTHPASAELPVVFFELLARRIAETDEMDTFIRGLRLPLAIRRYFQENPGDLPAYISKVIEAFPGVISRAGWLADEAGLKEVFSRDFGKEDLKALLTSRLATASAKDLPIIAEQIAKISGFNAPEQIQIAQYTEVRQLLASAAPALDESGYRPLPSASPKKLSPPKGAVV